MVVNLNFTTIHKTLTGKAIIRFLKNVLVDLHNFFFIENPRDIHTFIVPAPADLIDTTSWPRKSFDIHLVIKYELRI